MTRPLPPAPRAQLSTLLLLLVLLALIIASFSTLALDWRALLSRDAARSTAEFLRGFVPIDTDSAFLRRVVLASFETMAMSAVGTAIAALLGMGLALPASGRFGQVARSGARLLQNALRSIPELVWAAILLIAAGLGPFAGTLALAVHTTGVLGRLFADALENVPAAPESALRINGASAMSAFFYAALPQALPQILSYTLYRWENNIRAAAILGVVGAGGTGQMLKYYLSLFLMHQAATTIVAMMVLVAIVDAVSFGLRRLLTR